MPGLREEGEPADTERFYSIQNFLAAEDNEPAPASKSEPIRIRKVDYYRKLCKYVKATSMLSNTPDNNLKQEASRYELRDGMLYNSELNTPVIITLDDLVCGYH